MCSAAVSTDAAPAALQRAALFATAPSIDHPALLRRNRGDLLAAGDRAAITPAASIEE